MRHVPWRRPEGYGRCVSVHRRALTTATARQLYDFKSGTRDGKNAITMKPVVMRITDEDIVDLSAYVASLQP
jgi:cytochrome c553